MPRIRPCPQGKETHVFEEFCIKQHLLREVNAVSAEICLAQRHFWTLHWTALTAFLALDVRFWGLKSVPALGGRKRTFVEEFCVKQHLLREVNAVSAEICLAGRHF